MNLNNLDKEEYKGILLYRMSDNKHGDLPLFIRRYSPDSLFTPLHKHDYMQVNYCCMGKARHYINDHEFDIIKGDIFVIPPYQPHYIMPCQDITAEIYEFEFKSEFINQSFGTMGNIESFFDFAYLEPFLVSENRMKPRLNLTGKLQIEVEDIFCEALTEYDSRKSGYLLLIKSLLLRLLVILGREFTKDLENNSESRSIYDRHRDSIFKTIEYINGNYADDLCIEDVSRRSTFSQSYFSYLFKSITSKTFTEYVNGIRITKAMELLQSTDKRVLDICYDVGFNNVNHFNRIFRQQTGMSPLAYKKASRP